MRLFHCSAACGLVPYRSLAALAWAVVLSGLVWGWSGAGLVCAAGPSEKLLPSSTKGYFSVPDMAQARKKWDATGWGRLAADPKMRPFVKDLNRQVMQKIADTGVRLGIGWEDLEDVYGGEVCVAAIQPDRKSRQQHAIAMLVDVSGHLEQAQQLLAKVKMNLKGDGAKESSQKIAGVDTVVLSVPPKGSRRSYKAYYAIVDNWLVALDHDRVAADVLARFGKKGPAGEDSLARAPAFQKAMKESRRHLGETQIHVRWFVEPIGFLKVLRASRRGRRNSQNDIVKLISQQGFDAIQGIGGYVVFSTGEYEMLHYSYAHAPPPYKLAARMMEFPNGGSLAPHRWVPRDLAAYGAFNLKTKDGFEYSKSLINARFNAGEDDDYFEDVIRGLKVDPAGPRVDIRNDIVQHLANRAIVISDYRDPITTKSERTMVAIQCINPAKINQAINKLMRNDRNAKRREHKGYIIWEMIDPQNKPRNRPGGGVSRSRSRRAQGGRINRGRGGQGGNNAQIPNSAICVANGHLFLASHVDFIVEMLNKGGPGDSLADAADFQLVQQHLDKLGGKENSFRFFSRTDEEYRANYELLRQGKMPQSETLLGQVLNQILGGDGGVLREQQIDPAKMPPYDVVRRYFGPSGIYVRTEDNGWFVGGFFLSKE